MTRKDRTEGIYSRREVLDESERRQFYLIQLKELLTYAGIGPSDRARTVPPFHYCYGTSLLPPHLMAGGSLRSRRTWAYAAGVNFPGFPRRCASA